MSDTLDKRYLDMAARLALLGLGRVGDGALVGCVIAQGEEVVSVGAHRRFGGRHAETRALAGASSRGKDIKGATAYVTLEPCAMCVGALVHARIKRLDIGAREPKTGAVVSTLKLLDDGSFNHRVTWEEGVGAAEARELMQTFFAERRARA